jgi:imidazolonepropionase-like amidohydrolase
MTVHVIRHATLIDGTSAPPVRDATIVVKDQRIDGLGPDGRVPFPEDAVVYDGAGCTVLPGLIDAHVHTAYTGAADTLYFIKDLGSLFAIRSTVHARLLLEAGLTAVRDGGGTAYADIALRQAIDRGLVPGPRVRACGYALRMTGGHGDSFYRPEVEIDSPGLVNSADDARRAARTNLKMGADHIKILSASGGVLSEGPEPGLPQFTVEEMKAAIDEAHKQGKRAMAHAHGTQAVKNAILAGVDSVEHGSILDDEAIDMMLRRGVYYVPTLVAARRIVENADGGGLLPIFVQKARRIIDLHAESFRKAVAAGVKVAMGTDAGTPFNFHGDNLVELPLMVEGGMTPMQAIVASTSVGAELLDLADRVGTLASGKLADIVVVRGDPLADIGLFRDKSRVVLVMKNGVIVRTVLATERISVAA